MTRLLAVSHTGLRSGAERVLERALVAAVEAGWDVTCCLPDGPLEARLVAVGVVTVRLPALSLSAAGLPVAATGLAVRSARAALVVRRAARRADVVLVNGLLALPAVRAARLRAPVVWFVHDVVRRPLWQAVVRTAAPAVDVALCVSEAAAAPVREAGLRTVVVPQGTAWPVLPREDREGPPVVGCVALLTPWKGVDLLLEAFAVLDAPAVLEIVGGRFPKDAQHVAALQTRASEPDLAGRVRFAGPVDDVLDRMRGWTVLVSPSVEPETGPLVVFEAMSVGLPVVATAHGGPLEFVGDAGVLVPPGDVPALSRALAQLLADAPARTAMGDAGRRQVETRYALTERLADVLAVLRDAARLRPGQGLPPAPDAPDLRIGVVSYNTAALLDRCLRALPAALGGLRAEVVVVDNASTDDSVDVARAHAGVVVHRSANVGYARSMNRALAGSAAPVLLALNPDTVPSPESLALLVRRLLAEPDAGCVVPVLRNEDGSLQHSVHRFPSVTTALVMGLVPQRLRRGPVGRHWWLEGFAPHDRAQPVDWAIGAVHCLRADAVAGAGPYSERWFMYAEDMELCWRLRRRGWRTVLEPASEVVHVGNAAGEVEFGQGREQRWMDATYDWYVAARGGPAARLYAAANVVGLTVKLAVLARDRQAGTRRAGLAALRAHHARRMRAPRTAAGTG